MNDFDKLTSRSNTVEKGISGLKGRSLEASQIEM